MFSCVQHPTLTGRPFAPRVLLPAACLRSGEHTAPGWNNPGRVAQPHRTESGRAEHFAEDSSGPIRRLPVYDSSHRLAFPPAAGVLLGLSVPSSRARFTTVSRALPNRGRCPDKSPTIGRGAIPHVGSGSFPNQGISGAFRCLRPASRRADGLGCEVFSLKCESSDKAGECPFRGQPTMPAANGFQPHRSAICGFHTAENPACEGSGMKPNGPTIAGELVCGLGQGDERFAVQRQCAVHQVPRSRCHRT